MSNIKGKLVYQLEKGDKRCVYLNKIIVINPDKPPYYIDKDGLVREVINKEVLTNE